MSIRKRTAPAAAALLLAAAMVQPATAQTRVAQCEAEARACRAASTTKGIFDSACTARYDACMNRNRCVEVYASCLELMELEEGVTEAQCVQKRTACEQAGVSKRADN